MEMCVVAAGTSASCVREWLGTCFLCVRADDLSLTQRRSRYSFKREISNATSSSLLAFRQEQFHANTSVDVRFDENTCIGLCIFSFFDLFTLPTPPQPRDRPMVVCE